MKKSGPWPRQTCGSTFPEAARSRSFSSYLIAAAGELAIKLNIVPWNEGSVRDAASWALEKIIEQRNGTEPAEVTQAIEQVRLFIEVHGESRFERLGTASGEHVTDVDSRAVNNRAGWTRGLGPDQEWLIPPQTWKTEICNGLDSKFVAKTLGARGYLRLPSSGSLGSAKINRRATRVYILTAAILAGEADEA